MKRLLLLSVLASALFVTPAPAQELFAHLGAMKDALAEISGLEFTRDVPYALITKEQFHNYLEQRLHETMKPADLHAEEVTLKMLGLIPPDYDLRQSTLDLLTEQAAAFYDYNKKKLFVLEGAGESDEERVALVHELAHALADQHFHLAKYVQEGLRSDDASTARQAVMEGQATWLMAAYISRAAGGDAAVPEAVLKAMAHSMEISAAQQYPVFSKAPPYIRESLVFPYADGLLFQDAVYRKLGRAAFAEVFRRPPASTRQILHPEQYLDHVAPDIPALPSPPSAHAFKKLADGTLGELDFRVLLSEYLDPGAGVALAAHLAGSSYEVLEHKHDKFDVLGVASRWDSEDSARQYFEQYRRVLKAKWKSLKISGDSPASFQGRGDTGYFRVWIDGATVNQLEGWSSPEPLGIR
ncbi:MAG TPA: hypothetical protein VMB25_06800 [Bryobacteraceae bacterium]|nr:hypothetical protein [Bryobacteraceae bacterium]